MASGEEEEDPFQVLFPEIPESTEEIYFAVVGDVHGQFKSTVNLVSQQEKKLQKKFSFVLQVGDLECHRNEDDLATMAAPAKHRRMGDFPLFHEGTETFPWPIIFIGGNHEPYGWLEEYQEGGFLIPNLYYAGRTNLIKVGGIRMALLSGIHRLERFDLGRPPSHLMPHKSKREWIGFSSADLANLYSSVHEEGMVDVLMTHDWPADVASRDLMGEKARTTRPLGNQPCRDLANYLKPSLYVCGHMHAAYRTTISHPGSNLETRLCCLAKVPTCESVAVYRSTYDPEKKCRQIKEIRLTPLPSFKIETSLGPDDD